MLIFMVSKNDCRSVVWPAWVKHPDALKVTPGSLPPPVYLYSAKKQTFTGTFWVPGTDLGRGKARS